MCQLGESFLVVVKWLVSKINQLSKPTHVQFVHAHPYRWLMQSTLVLGDLEKTIWSEGEGEREMREKGANEKTNWKVRSIYLSYIKRVVWAFGWHGDDSEFDLLELAFRCCFEVGWRSWLQWELKCCQKLMTIDDRKGGLSDRILFPGVKLI